MGTVTPKQAADGFNQFVSKQDGLILEGLDNGINFAAKLSVTEFMQGGSSRDGFVDPANPPPGPLKIRSGNLRRLMVVIKARKTGSAEYTAGLGNEAVYAAIHEFGGKTSAHFIQAREADTLAFVGRDGGLVFRETVFHPGSNIPARPFIQPALDLAGPMIEKEIAESMVRGIEDIFR